MVDELGGPRVFSPSKTSLKVWWATFDTTDRLTWRRRPMTMDLGPSRRMLYPRPGRPINLVLQETESATVAGTWWNTWAGFPKPVRLS